MGTDTPGHDMLALVLRGVQKSVQVALVVAVLSTLIGVVVGGLAGFFGGVVDNLLMRLADVVLIVPGIAVLAVLAASVQDVEGNWFLIGLILSALMWVPTARLLRAAVLSLREEAYVEAARAAGAGPGPHPRPPRRPGCRRHHHHLRHPDRRRRHPGRGGA